MRRIYKKIGAVLCTIAVILTMLVTLPASVFAADYVAVTFICERNGTVLPGIEWKLYRIGTYDGTKITMTGAFADYKVNFGDYSGRALADAASTLENYVIVNKPSCDAEGTSDANGRVGFSTLESGAYLAVAKRLKEGMKSTVPAPTIINVDISNGPALQVYPKFKVLLTLAEEIIRYEVRKVWENPHSLSLEKSEITIGIYADGELYETVKLNEGNDWRYYWTAMDDGTDWRVIEQNVPEDCTVIYRNDEMDYVIVNIYEPYIPDPSVTTTSSSTVTTTSGTGTSATTTATRISTAENTEEVRTTSGETAKTTAAATTKTTTSDKIPQTGQLWWPVPVLVVLGLVLVAAGIKITMAGKKKND